MKKNILTHNKIILDLEKLNTINANGCPGCGGRFNLGDSVVLACGSWEGGPKYVHEHETVYDAGSATHYERRCYEAMRHG